MSNYDPAEYRPETCNSSVSVYGIYLCRLNGGVPCAHHKGEMCYAEKVDRATNELVKAMREKEKSKDVKSRPGMEQTCPDDNETFS